VGLVPRLRPKACAKSDLKSLGRPAKGAPHDGRQHRHNIAWIARAAG
jgi:hypothetical protein